MIYAVSVSAAALFTLFFFFYMKKTEYFVLAEKPPEEEGNAADKIEKENDTAFSAVENKNTEAVYNKKQSVLFTVSFFLIAVLMNYFVYMYSYKTSDAALTGQPFIFLKMAVTHMICACAALTDYKRSKIPNKLIVIGLVSRAVIYIAEIITAWGYIKEIFINDMIGFAIGFIMLFVIAVITRGGIGFGDVKLFGVIGLMAGSGGVFAVLFLSLLFSSVISIILMLTRKKTLRSSLPMAPSIYLGFAVTVILGTF